MPFTKAPMLLASLCTAISLAGAAAARSTELKSVDLPESSEARQIFYKKATGRDAAQVRAVWARLIFIGRRPTAKSASRPA
jgi:hypothetical protein